MGAHSRRRRLGQDDVCVYVVAVERNPPERRVEPRSLDGQTLLSFAC